MKLILMIANILALLTKKTREVREIVILMFALELLVSGKTF